MLFLQSVRDLTHLLLEVGAPAVVVHPVFLEDGQHLLDVGDDGVDVQLALHHGVEAEDGGAVVQLHLLGVGHFETGLEQIDRRLLQQIELLAGKVVLNLVIQIRVAAIGQQLVDDGGGLFAPLLHIGIHINPRRCWMDVTPASRVGPDHGQGMSAAKHTRRARQAQSMGQDNWRLFRLGANGQPSARQAARHPS